MSSQDWIEKDFYKVLGVAKDAEPAAIKKAYRKLARKYHPDKNPGDKQAEARFKDIGEAYGVLSDPKQRQQYDAIRQMAGGGPRFSAGPAGSGGGFQDLFSGMFGGEGENVRFETSGGNIDDILRMFGGGGGHRARQGAGSFGGFGGFNAPTQGADLNATTTLSFRDAAAGTTVTLQIGGRNVTTRIPAGVKDGQKIRLRGKGHPGENGGAPGDMVIQVHVTPHPVFTMDGKNLRMDLPVTFAEAALGATVAVPTLSGDEVRVKIPAGTPSGRVLRVKGRGVQTKGKSGDLLLTIQVTVPQHLSDAAKDAITQFADATRDDDPRANLASQAAK